jgi:hypothetical protein
MLLTESPFRVRRLGGSIVLFYEPGGGKIAIGFLLKDLIAEAWSVRADTLVLPLSCLNTSFFDLATGMARATLRPLSNYRITIAFLGSIPSEYLESVELRTFIRESNRGRSAWFLDDFAALEARLS